jgi:hypothetical protein
MSVSRWTPSSESTRLAKVFRFDGASTTGDPYQMMYVQMRSDACTAGADWLASLLIHEAMHMCPVAAMSLGDPAAAVTNQTFCGSVLPGESGL